MVILKQNDPKLKRLSIFILITIFYFITRILLFRGFNGTDDIHYAMLSSKFLKGGYSAFNRFDIFGGRVLLICFQAFLYKILGITVFSTQIGSVIITVIACYLTIFQLIKTSSNTALAFFSSAFYFNPVIIKSTVGPAPDGWVMLTCILLLILVKQIMVKEKTEKTKYIYGFQIAVLIVLSLLFKETTILFLPWVCVLLVLKAKPNGLTLSFFVTGIFLLGIAVIGLIYFMHTGDFFFKIAQIENSDPLSGRSLLFPKPSYIIWLNLLTAGFYPVVFGMGLLFTQIFKKYRSATGNNYLGIAFLLLLIISYFFQLLFVNDNPLTPEPRQFLFLLPIALAYLSPTMENILTSRGSVHVLILSLLLMLICMLNTSNKWQWMVYTLMFLLLLAKYLIKNLTPTIFALCFIFTLWVSVLEPLYLSRPEWLSDLSRLSKKLNSKSYYFPERDNMAHWSLLHQFDNTKGQTFNLDTNVMYLLKQYDTDLTEENFTPGWLIVNEDYSKRSKPFFNTMDSLNQSGYFSKKDKQGNILAYYINHYVQIGVIRAAVLKDLKNKR